MSRRGQRLPRLWAMASEHGGIVRGMMARGQLRGGSQGRGEPPRARGRPPPICSPSPAASCSSTRTSAHWRSVSTNTPSPRSIGDPAVARGAGDRRRAGVPRARPRDPGPGRSPARGHVRTRAPRSRRTPGRPARGRDSRTPRPRGRAAAARLRIPRAAGRGLPPRPPHAAGPRSPLRLEHLRRPRSLGHLVGHRHVPGERRVGPRPRPPRGSRGRQAGEGSRRPRGRDVERAAPHRPSARGGLAFSAGPT